MAQGKTQYQPLGICHRLLKFLTKSLSALAVMPPTLGSTVGGGLAIFHRLFDLIMQIVAAQAMKLVTLGPPPVPHFDASGQNIVQPMDPEMPCEGKSPLAKVDSEQAGAVEKDGNELPPVQDQDDDKKSENVSVDKTIADQPEARGIKKTVSINEKVEEIHPVKKKKKMTVPKKVPSMESEKDEEGKPLRSILKVGPK